VTVAARALITAGGLLGLLVAVSIGVTDIAVLTIGLTGAASAGLGWRMSRLRPGHLMHAYAWACCIFGATMAGQGYLLLRLGVSGVGTTEAWLWIISGITIIAGATSALVLKPRAAR
jgi:hypothetical protein